jgi:hypothetical protein
MLPNVRGFSTGLHAASTDVTPKDSMRTRVAAPSLKAADIGKHVRACSLTQKAESRRQRTGKRWAMPKRL